MIAERAEWARVATGSDDVGLAEAYGPGCSPVGTRPYLEDGSDSVP